MNWLYRIVLCEKILGISLLLLLAGCAVMPGNELPRIDKAGSSVDGKPVPIIFSFQWGTEEIDPYQNPDEYEQSWKQQAMAARAVIASRRFEGANRLSSPASTYTLKYLVRRNDPPLLTAFTSVLSDLTLTLVPGFDTRRWTLTAELFDPEGASIWRRDYTDSVKVVYWLPLFPVTIVQGTKFMTADDDVLVNLYRQPVSALEESDLFQKKKKTNLFRQIPVPK